jgi:hypothetical protein
MSSLQMAKSYAIKDACKDFGKLFGHEIVKMKQWD